MISAADLRRSQEASRQERDAKIIERVRSASTKYVDIILEEAKKALEYAQRTNKSYIILDHRDITRDVEGLSYTTLLYGFWDRSTEKFDDSIFIKNDIPRPLDRAIAELEKFGYKLENVSDPTRSRRLFLKLSW